MRILGILSVLAAFAIAALENGLSKLPEPSGVTVTFDAAKPAGSRILEAKIGGAPIDPKAKYTLATADFLLNGGDGYTMLGKGEVIRPAEGGLLMANDVMVLARKRGNIAATIEGRMAPVK